MCFIVAETEKGTWQGYRSVEVLSYHKERQKIRILFLLYMQNNKENNSIRLLHPGKALCRLADFSNGLPQHRDEWRIQRNQNKTCVLKSIYNQVFAFNAKEKNFRLKNILTSWDSLGGFEFNKQEENNEQELEEQRRITIGNNIPNITIHRLISKKYPRKLAWFSAWEIGPFASEGKYILAFDVVILKPTYSKMVSQTSFFTIDGSRELMDKFCNSLLYSTEDEKEWEEQLALFQNQLNFKGGYDVVLLDNPYGDKVITDLASSRWITKGVLKPKVQQSFKRCITANPKFQLLLCYADSLTKKTNEYHNLATK